VRNNPDNIISYGKQYFEELLKQRGYFDPHVREKVEFKTKEFYLSHKELFKEYYTLGASIGTGGVSDVRICQHKQTGV
jgi:hypothetical protein